ncbi:MAG: hypothetical protein KDD38_03660 [Bdellovibrionales bacterium]|nr:hypothetical protein [Bdellovibrionales bacterium]
MYLLLLSVLSSSLVHATGFTTGNQFESSHIYGSVTVVCAGNPRSRFEHCDANILDPVEFDYFQYDGGSEATKVKLTNKINGKAYTSTKKFNSETGKSKSRFNLWVSTVLQTPLLGYGLNKISYELTKNKKTVESGEFEVLVNRGQARRCRPRTIYSSLPSNCEIGGASVCPQYFRDENYCQ